MRRFYEFLYYNSECYDIRILQSTSTPVLSGSCRHVGVAAKKDEKPYAVVSFELMGFHKCLQLEDGFRPLASYRPGSVDLDDEKDENSPNRPWVNRVMVDPVGNQVRGHGGFCGFIRFLLYWVPLNKSIEMFRNCNIVGRECRRIKTGRMHGRPHDLSIILPVRQSIN